MWAASKDILPVAWMAVAKADKMVEMLALLMVEMLAVD
jgi:hypothetical protein